METTSSNENDFMFRKPGFEDSLTYSLCDLGQVPELLWTSIPLSKMKIIIPTSQDEYGRSDSAY